MMTDEEKTKALEWLQGLTTAKLRKLEEGLGEFAEYFNLSDNEQWWLDNYREEIKRREGT